ncbi:MAG: hypothetical protein L0Y74_01320 [candidate division Zixibacteria bacterium]|nr:hypothetical protein [candidate division Zixibacteria bacterium]
MSDEWEDLGETNDFLDLASLGLAKLIFPTVHEVENKETGEIRRVVVGRGQTLGEAIQNGQFTD